MTAEYRSTKIDVAQRFSYHIRGEAWLIEPLASKNVKADIVATKDGAALFAQVVGEFSPAGRPVSLVRETSAALFKAAALRSAFPYERICVVAGAAFAVDHPLRAALAVANAARIELWLMPLHGEPERVIDHDCGFVLDTIAGVSEIALKRWPQDYYQPIRSGDATILIDGEPHGPAIVMNDELDDEEYDLDCLSASVAMGRQTLSFGGFYISRSDQMPGTCMITLYDYTFGTDFPSINATIAAIREMMPLNSSRRDRAGFRGYVVGNDPFGRDRFAVYVGDSILVSSNHTSRQQALASITYFIERRRKRIVDNDVYR